MVFHSSTKIIHILLKFIAPFRCSRFKLGVHNVIHPTLGFLYTSFWRMAIFFLRDVDGVALLTSGYQHLNHDSFLIMYLLMVPFLLAVKCLELSPKQSFIRQLPGYMH